MRVRVGRTLDESQPGRQSGSLRYPSLVLTSTEGPSSNPVAGERRTGYVGATMASPVEACEVWPCRWLS